MTKKILKPLSLLAIFSICIYFFARLYFFSYSNYRGYDIVFGLFLIVGEAYMVIHVLGFSINIFRIAGSRPRFPEIDFKEDVPSVAVVVAVRNEPAKIIENTFATFRALDYPNKKLYLLDDSDDAVFLKKDKRLVDKFDISYFHPSFLHGAKAGIENDFVDQMKEEYLAVFDVDQNPMPDFLRKTVSIAEKDSKNGFVQTPQVYSNIDTSNIAQGAAMQQSVFYESICEAKGKVNAMFCCGTNVLFRTEALRSVGGFDENSVTEDFATSIKLHLKGWKSVYYNHACVFGMGPETLPAYFKQQFRWSAGTIGIFRKILTEFIKNPFRLSLAQWWEYFLSGTYYFMGWAFFLLMLCPIAYLLFGIPSYFLMPQVYIFTYLPYLAMTFLVFYGTMKERHYRFSNVYHGIIMSSLIFPILMVSSLAGISGKKLKFEITPKGKGKGASLSSLWPWITMIGLNIIAIIVGVEKFNNNPYAISVNIFWATYHIFILSHIFYFNSDKQKETNEQFGSTATA